MVSPPRGRVFSCSRQVATPPPLIIAPPPSNNPQRGQGRGSISTRPPLRGVFQSSPISSHLVPLLFLGVPKCDDNQTTISLATPNPPHTHDTHHAVIPHIHAICRLRRDRPPSSSQDSKPAAAAGPASASNAATCPSLPHRADEAAASSPPHPGRSPTPTTKSSLGVRCSPRAKVYGPNCGWGSTWDGQHDQASQKGLEVSSSSCSCSTEECVLELLSQSSTQLRRSCVLVLPSWMFHGLVFIMVCIIVVQR